MSGIHFGPKQPPEDSSRDHIEEPEPKRKGTPRKGSTRKKDLVAFPPSVVVSEEIGKRERGRPKAYTPELADEIIERIALGESMVSVCADKKMPSRSTVMLWEDDPACDSFSVRLEEAKGKRLEALPELILHHADDMSRDMRFERVVGEDGTTTVTKEMPNAVAVARAKLQIDTKLRFLGQLNAAVWAPKQVARHEHGFVPVSEPSTINLALLPKQTALMLADMLRLVHRVQETAEANMIEGEAVEG